MKVGRPDGVKAVNPKTQYEVWLTGSVNYAIIQYKDEDGNKARVLSSNLGDRLVSQIAGGHLFLIEAKRVHAALITFTPEAVCQALALATHENRSKARFCLSNGTDWMFGLMTKGDDQRWSLYLSEEISISKNTEEGLGQLLQLLCQWVDPQEIPGLVRLGEDLENP